MPWWTKNVNTMTDRWAEWLMDRQKTRCLYRTLLKQVQQQKKQKKLKNKFTPIHQQYKNIKQQIGHVYNTYLPWTESYAHFTLREESNIFHPIKMYGSISKFFYHFHKGEQLPWLPVCFHGGWRATKRGSTLKGKNLLLEEQILSFMSWPPFEKLGKKWKWQSGFPWNWYHSP